MCRHETAKDYGTKHFWDYTSQFCPFQTPYGNEIICGENEKCRYNPKVVKINPLTTEYHYNKEEEK